MKHSFILIKSPLASINPGFLGRLIEAARSSKTRVCSVCWEGNLPAIVVKSSGPRRVTPCGHRDYHLKQYVISWTEMVW